MTVYFISGLGADRHVFSRLKLPASVVIRHIDWIEPLNKESFTDYCKRLAQQIEPADEVVLIGLSFGGMVAIELNEIIHPKQIILISSAATKYEFPFLFRMIHFFRLHLLVPVTLLKKLTPMARWFFNARTKKERTLLHTYLTTVSDNYLKWSINEVMNWKNAQKPAKVFHIHGRIDRVFPYQRTKADVLIDQGGHLMVYDKAEEVSKVVCERLAMLL